MSTPFRLTLPRQLYTEMVAHAQAELPNECCGFFAGKIGTDGIAHIERRYGMINVLASPTRYEWDPRGHIAAQREMRPLDLEMLAIYHSHPMTAPIPSHTDRSQYEEARALLGDLIHFIIGLAGTTPEVRGWWLTADEHREADWQLV